MYRLPSRSWQRSAEGRWSAAVDLATEDQPLSYKHDNVYVLRPALVVQRHAPANFVPIAWTCEGQKWIKYLRVPVGPFVYFMALMVAVTGVVHLAKVIYPSPPRGAAEFDPEKASTT